MRTEFLCISVLRVASGPRVKLASCKSALTRPHRSPSPPPPPLLTVLRRWFRCLVLLFVALLFILWGDFISYLVIFCSCVFQSLPRLGKRELILLLFVRLFDLRLFGFVCFLSLDFSLTFFWYDSPRTEPATSRSQSGRSTNWTSVPVRWMSDIFLFVELWKEETCSLHLFKRETYFFDSIPNF